MANFNIHFLTKIIFFSDDAQVAKKNRLLHLVIKQKTMKNILVPVDFSEQSVYAFRFALDIAKASKGNLQLLHVISLPILQDSALLPVDGFRKPLIEELRAAAVEKFDRLKGEFELEGVTIQLNVVDGSVHASVIDFIRNREVELVVMGTRGASGVREWMVGSNTEKIVRNSPVPVIAIKNYHPGWTISDIVFPNTLDIEDQEDLVTNVKALQHLFQAKVHIIWVNTPAVNKPENEIRKKLQAFAQRFMFTNFTINIFNYTDEEAGIVAFTNQINADMIAMGTHGLKGIAHLLAGSVAEDVVNHVACPVWTYCAKSARALSRTKNHHEISDRRSK